MTRMPARSAPTALLLLLTGLSSPARTQEPSPGAREVFVSPGGDDTNEGTREAPFATLGRARDALRELRGLAPEAAAEATVWLSPGRYERAASLRLDRRDSHCMWRALPGGPVVLSGGRSLEVSRLPRLEDEELLRRIPADPENLRILDLRALGAAPDPAWPDAFRGYGGWPELFVEGQPLRIARWPDDGYAKIEEVLERGSRPRHDETPDRPGSFRFAEDEPLHWDTAQEIYLDGYWCFGWYDEVLRVARLDHDRKSIHFAAPHHYGIGGPSGGLYHSLNVLETLDQPGEFVVDRAAERLYLCLPEIGAQSELSVSLLREPLLLVEGATGIRFTGLDFESGRGEGARLEDCTDCVFTSGRFRNFAGFALRIDRGRNCGLEGAEISGTGLGGVSLGGGDRATLTPSAHFVREARIHHYARLVRTYQPAVSLSGVGQIVERCDIHDAPHQAISFRGNDHRIRQNRIERVCLDTGDAGAIYCGRDWTLGGTVIEQNWFAEIGRGAHHHNWAVYPDDQASGLVVRHNVVLDCPSGFLFGGGRSNVVEDNLFVNVGQWPIRFDARGMGWGKVSEPTLLKGLAEVPADSEVWRQRFPWLTALATDDRRNWPLHNRIEGNLFVDSHAPSFDPPVLEGGTVRANRSVATDGEWRPELREERLVLPAGGPEVPDEIMRMRVGVGAGKEPSRRRENG